MILNYIPNIRRNYPLLRQISRQSGKSKKSICLDYLALKRSTRLTFNEYFCFEFENQDENFRNSFLDEYEQRSYLDVLNPKKYYTVARNKYFTHLFLESLSIRKAELYCYYNPLCKLYSNSKIGWDYQSVIQILRSSNVQSCVIKTTESSHGDNVKVIHGIEYLDNDCILSCYDDTKLKLSDILKFEPLLFERVIKQTKQLESFNKTSVNTVRFMTVLYPNSEAKIIGTFIKMGRSGSCVDNAGSGGNVDAAVDVEKGELHYVVQFDGYRKIKPIKRHPDSEQQLEGIVIDNWQHIKNEVIHYQQALPYVKAAGWDIAITDEGPVVLEVNDYWDRTGQLFLRKGWKMEISDCYQSWKRLEDKHLISFSLRRP